MKSHLNTKLIKKQANVHQKVQLQMVIWSLREKIQKLQGAMIDAEAHGAIFVTTSSFTRTAIDYAQRNGIELVDGEALDAMIQEVIGG